MQTPGAPILHIKLTTTNAVMVYWLSSAADYFLEVSTNPATTNWIKSAEIIQTNGMLQYVIVSPPTGNRYFRLRIP